MKRYRVKFGKHKDEAGKLFEVGDVIEFAGDPPPGFADKFEPLKSTKALFEQVSEIINDPAGKPTYKAKHKGAGRWVVINDEGNQPHDGYLTKEDARELAESL